MTDVSPSVRRDINSSVVDSLFMLNLLKMHQCVVCNPTYCRSVPSQARINSEGCGRKSIQQNCSRLCGCCKPASGHTVIAGEFQ